MGRDVADEQVDVADVTLHGQTLYLLVVTGVQHHAGQSLQGAAANADAADVVNVVTVTLHKAGTRTHRHHNSLRQPRLETGAQTVGNELVHLLCRNAVHGLVNVGCSHACQHHLLYV